MAGSHWMSLDVWMIEDLFPVICRMLSSANVGPIRALGSPTISLAASLMDSGEGVVCRNSECFGSLAHLSEIVETSFLAVSLTDLGEGVVCRNSECFGSLAHISEIAGVKSEVFQCSVFSR
ncbi:hypothetical protein RRG08_013387 [Elysia crispata]|uniref:Uncharacterized protein n=1 Tax=Elysia crispata TaxID=231223 RepID=A0AAE1B7B2_9GAST|nr:hypothetical protein RRG08_013387 [Elysia crispata]